MHEMQLSLKQVDPYANILCVNMTLLSSVDRLIKRSMFRHLQKFSLGACVTVCV